MVKSLARVNRYSRQDIHFIFRTRKDVEVFNEFWKGCENYILANRKKMKQKKSLKPSNLLNEKTSRHLNNWIFILKF